MSVQADILLSYFQVKWEKNRTAMEAFDLAKEAAASHFEKIAADIRSIKFDNFRAHCCHESVTKTSRRD